MQPTLVTLSLALFAVQGPSFTQASLFTRQSSADGLGLSNIPDACQVTCSPITNTVNSCQELSCLCNNDAAKQIADCADCLVAVAGDSASSLQTQEQTIIDQYTNACSTSGKPVSSIKVSSVAPSGSGSDSSTATATSSAASGSTSTTSTASSSATSNGSHRVRQSAGAGVAVLAGLIALLVSA